MKTWLGATFFAGWFTAMLEAKHPQYLLSFYYGLTERQKSMIDPSQFSFFLDSGAYSAWSQGTEIDIDEYAAFIRHNIEHIEVYANLDVIAGQPGRHASAAEREEGARLSWENFLYLRREGLRPLPVYHAGESWKWLDNMLSYGCDYIGLGGLVGLNAERRRDWLDTVFKRITDKEGMPIVKTHGFGMTAIPLIFRYPWHSVDSTTWIKITANGGIYLPAMVDDEFVFDQVPMSVTVSSRNPNQLQGGKAANTMSPAMRRILDRWLTICGKTYAQVCDHYYHRAVCNVIYFRHVSEVKAVRPFRPDGIRKQTIWA